MPVKTPKKHALTPAMEANKWKKGCPSPNPAGRPPGSLDIWARIRAKARQKVKEGPHKGKEYLDLVADAYIEACATGHWQQTKEMIDREEGPLGKPGSGTTVNVNVTQVGEDDLVRIATRGSNGTVEA